MEESASSEKECWDCHVVKVLDEYPTGQKCRDGHTGRCKECTNAHAKERRIQRNEENARYLAKLRTEAEAEKSAASFRVPAQRCTRCNEKKPVTAFAAVYSQQQFSRKIKSRSPECRPCAKLTRQEKAQEKKWQGRVEETLALDWQSRIEVKRAKQYEETIRHQYGMSLERYNAMLEAQSGLCAICGCTGTLVVDHNHITGAVRGLLCERCNFGLGHFKDNIENIQKAIVYLRYHDFW